MIDIDLARAVFKVIDSVVCLVAVNMVYVKSLGPGANERFCYKRMNVAIPSVTTKANP